MSRALAIFLLSALVAAGQDSRVVVAVDAAGLPTQISIPPLATELPLLPDGKRETAEATDLAAIGRGPMLGAPLQLVAVIDGNETAFAVAAPAKDGQAAQLKAGDVTGALQVTRHANGNIGVALTVGGGSVDELALLITFAGPVDLLLAGDPAARHVVVTLPPRVTGPLWGNAAADAERAGTAPLPGLITQAYAGSADRGLSWLADPTSDWQVADELSTMTVSGNDAGQVVWRLRLINRRTALASSTFRFALLPHPSAPPHGGRRRAWLDSWPADSRSLPTTYASWPQPAQPSPPLRADAAALFEPAGCLSLLTGPAGGDAGAAGHIATYPLPLFRYLAGTHTGVLARLQPNANQLTHLGGNKAPDREVLGRALLHDIGIDASRLTHLVEARRIAQALDDFGYFSDDDLTEYIPYWRSEQILRFGEAIVADDSFAESAEPPAAKVRVSVWRRPHGRGIKTMIVILNEGETAVDDQLYVLGPQRLWGGANQHRFAAVVDRYDFSRTPASSDWGQPGMLSSGIRGDDIVLEDLEHHGIIKLASRRDNIEAYGPTIHIRERDFRLLYGYHDQ